MMVGIAITAMDYGVSKGVFGLFFFSLDENNCFVFVVVYLSSLNLITMG
jgi:hypothetical protein